MARKTVLVSRHVRHRRSPKEGRDLRITFRDARKGVREAGRHRDDAREARWPASVARRGRRPKARQYRLVGAARPRISTALRVTAAEPSGAGTTMGGMGLDAPRRAGERRQGRAPARALPGPLDREPVLIVPNRSDVDRVERDLLAAAGALLGGSIGTFDDLFERLAAAATPGPVASDAQRALVARARAGAAR